MRRSSRPLVVGLAALALFASACGSSSKTAATTTTAAPASTAAPTTTAAAPSAATLKDALLTVADLPSGYTAGTPSADDNSQVTTVPASCGDAINAFTKNAAKTNVKASFDSANQADNIGQTINADADLTTKWKSFKDILANQCKGTVQLTLTGGLTGTLEAVAAPGIGDDSLGLKLDVKGTSQGVAVDVSGYDVYVLHGPVVTDVSQLSTKAPSKQIDGGTINLADVIALATKANDKLGTALSGGSGSATTAPGDTSATTAPGDTSATTAPGDTSATTAPGDTSATTAPGDTSATTAPGDTTPTTTAP